MDIITRPYFWLEAIGLHKKSTGATREFISCAKNVSDVDNWDICRDAELKTNDELINLVKNFCSKINDEDTPYIRQSYKIQIKRCVRVFLSGCRTDCYGQGNDDFCFVLNKTNVLTYLSNIRDVLDKDFKEVYIDVGTNPYLGAKYVNSEDLKQNKYSTPLFVDKYDDERAWVRYVTDSCIIVNPDLLELHPLLTGNHPAKLLELLERKEEKINQLKQLGSSR